MREQETIYKIALKQTPQIGPVTARSLISYCGGVEQVFKASKKQLLKTPGVGEKTVDFLKSEDGFAVGLAQAEKELKHLEKHNIQVFFYTDEGYPQRLKHYTDSPILIYYKGNADLNHARIVGIVGTRKPTPQGMSICEELVEGLLPYNVLIISGLAYGIDITAHKKSVLTNTPTIGVMGHGFKTIYPRQHAKTANQMLENGGLISEFTYETEIAREHFPMRNRIIAGMSDALIVVETAQSGGSMITAQIANEYNKDVFAVPGRLKDKFSKGCNHLIKIHKAALIESAEDIAYVMRWSAEKEGRQTNLFVELSDLEKQIMSIIEQKEEAAIDLLSYEAKLKPGKMAAVLLELEFKGVVKSLPGKKYMLA